MFSRKNRYVSIKDIEFLKEFERANKWTIFDTIQYHKIVKAFKKAKAENKTGVCIYTLRPAVKQKLVEAGFSVHRNLGTYWVIN